MGLGRLDRKPNPSLIIAVVAELTVSWNSWGGNVFGMIRYFNLQSAQRRTQQIADQFNIDEQLWESLKGKRRLRRTLFPWLSKKRQRQLDLLDFAKAHPLQDCVGRIENDEIRSR